MLSRDLFESSEYGKIFNWIVNQLPLNFSEDSIAAKMLANKIEYDLDALNRGFQLIEGKEVAIVGNGPELEIIERIEGEVLVVADSALWKAVKKLRRTPDMLVTDFDGISGIDEGLMSKISLIVGHIHGDNFQAASNFIEKLRGLKGKVLFTTQRDPQPPFFNFGGFTDGDRSVFAALFFGARNVRVYSIGETVLPSRNSFPKSTRMRKFWIGKLLVEWLKCKGENVEIPLSGLIECSPFPWEAEMHESRH
ncbi:MAG: hypothetical protein QXT69_03250 [Fervidicoccaceae archaeon]